MQGRWFMKRGETVLSTGEPVREIGLVLDGSVRMENVDIWGHVSLLGRAEAGDIFAEAYALAPGEPLMVSVTADGRAEILFLSADGLSGTRPGPGRPSGGCSHCWPARASPSPAGLSTPPRKPSGKSSSPTSPTRPSRPGGRIFPSPLTASSWPITSASTGARCRVSSQRCGGKGYLSTGKTRLY